MFNTRGRPACAAAANLVFRIDGEMVTPPLSEGVLAGTTRTRLLEALPEMVERRLTWAEARKADALVLTNALRGIRPALSWDGRDLPGSGELKVRLEAGLSLREETDSLG
jgi:branched-subunit amino acid aminotransferase/4-amino-4-deoxychorismate lyase